MKIVSWNVNGIVACREKGFLQFLADTKPDVMCCQEVKTQCELDAPGYQQFWNPAKRPGYSGTLTLTKQTPLSWMNGIGVEEFDDEGRVVTLEYKDYFIVNVYVPSVNTNSKPDRSDFRLEWDKAFRKYVSKLPKPTVLAGDFNANLSDMDIYPENEKNEPDAPLFTPETREGMERLLSVGLVDAFRILYPQRTGAYTWWGPKNMNRADNRGSRLDYFLVSGELLSAVRSIKFHNDILGSDHCPISMLFYPAKTKREMRDDDLAAIWASMDWDRLEEILLSMQQDLAYAAYNREWDKVAEFQDELVRSWTARALAVRTALSKSTFPGVDGVRWTTDAQKAKAAMSLSPKNYRPLPYLYMELEENGKTRTNLIPTMRDKAMQILYSYALDPVAESTADRKSFFARIGRSALDVHAYLSRDLSGDDPPDYVALIDVQAFYDTVVHDWLVKHIPMDKVMLQKFLKAGMVLEGEMFPTDKGMSMASSLSPILGNMMLDGLQSFLYDHLYPSGGVDYKNGNLHRFADDMAITARSYAQAEKIMEITSKFLAQRGLRMHPDKSCIANVNTGFVYLGRHYQRKDGVLTTTPSDDSIKKMERELEKLIMNFSGTQRSLIEKINQKLKGWGSYHRVEDAYMVFRHIDVVVEGLLVKKMCTKYPRWGRKAILNRFWIKDGMTYTFILPTDPSVRVVQLAPLPIVRHKPCKLKFNPYLDQDYHVYLKHRRDVQKSNGKYRAVWTRQSGRCAYCNQRMLADQEIDLVEKNIGQGWKIKNLIYIHRRCGYQVCIGSEGAAGEHIDLFSMLDGVMDDAPAEESPYAELTEYFRTSKASVIRLHFQEIERILGDRLPWEAYCFKAFWYDDTPELSSSLWQNELYPFHTIQFTAPGYNIAHSWTKQGYKIKALHLETNQITFRRESKVVSGITLPKALTDQPLPDDVAYRFQKLVNQFVKDNGL